MNWFYESGGQQQGPVSDEELDQLVASGKVTPATLIWREGLANWQPLRDVRPTTAAQPAAPAAPAPAASAGPADAVRCDSCGRAVPRSEIIQIGQRSICATCKPSVLQQIQQGGEVVSVADVRNGPAWERREQLGLFKAGVETIKTALTLPSETFATMKREGGIGSPLYFLLLFGTITGEIGLLYQFGFQAIGMTAQARNGDPFSSIMGSTIGIVVMAVLLPLLIAIGAFIYAGILHLSLMVCGGALQPFETTFRAYCYSVGSANTLQVIPICGWIAGPIWGIVVCCIAMAKAHEITTGKAVLAVLLPIFVCCGFAVIGIIAFVAIMAHSGNFRTLGMITGVF